MNIDTTHVLFLGYGASIISTIRYLEAHQDNINITIYTSSNSEDMPYPKVSLDTLDTIHEDITCVVASPGIPKHDDIYTYLSDTDIPIINDIELAYHIRPDIRYISITGTNGKTTLSSMISYALTKLENRTIHVCGNIGVPIFDVLDSVDEGDFLVVELSSFQILRLKSYQSDVVVLSNLGSDHIDYHGSLATYRHDKVRIFEHLKEQGLGLSYYHYDELLPYKKKNLKIIEEHQTLNYEKTYCTYKDIQFKYSDFHLSGRHNFENLIQTFEILTYLDFEKKQSYQALQGFKGVPHRLEYITSFQNINFYNDSKATNIEATLTAHRSLSAIQILLIGGRSKGEDYHILFQEIDFDKVQSFYFLGENRYELKEAYLDLQKEQEQIQFPPYIVLERLEESLQHITGRMKQCEFNAYQTVNCILCPASTSFDQYKNFEERGKVFTVEIQKHSEGIV